MQSSDKFFTKHYGKELQKQMDEDQVELMKAEQRTNRKLHPAYEDQSLPGWKVKHGGTLGWGKD